MRYLRYASLLLITWWGLTLGHVKVTADSCSAFTGQGDCYVELDGCDGDDCTWTDGQNPGEGSLEGTNCTTWFASCVGNDWTVDLDTAGQCGGNTWCASTLRLLPIPD